MQHKEVNRLTTYTCTSWDNGSTAYLGLHHLHALGTQFPEALVHTESALCLHLLHHHIQEDKGPRAAHPRTAVHQQWLVQGDGVLLTHTTDKPDEGHDILRHPVVRPASVVELGDYHVPRVIFHELCMYIDKGRMKVLNMVVLMILLS